MGQKNRERKQKKHQYQIKHDPVFLRKGDVIEMHGQRIVVDEDGWYRVQADIKAIPKPDRP